MEFTNQKLTLNCTLSTENSSKKAKKRSSYMTVTLFHGCSREFEKQIVELDAKENVNIHFKDVNVETAYLSFQVFTHGKLLFSDKHVGDVNVLVSELLEGGQPSSTIHQLGKASRKSEKGSLRLLCELSKRGKDDKAAIGLITSHVWHNEVPASRRLNPAIGNDIELFKTLVRFRTPFVR